MIYGKVAQKLAALGYAVTPLNGKRPILGNWEQTTPATVTTDPKFDNCNIGLLCGAVSGVIVADIDTFNAELEAELIKAMPFTPVMKKGNKGINFIYAYHDSIPTRIKIHNPLDKRKVEVEFISGGGQTVIPRSIHPDSKKPYKWCDINGNESENHLLSVTRDNLPVITVEDVERIRLIVENHYKGVSAKKGIAGLLGHSDKSTHKDLPDYAPKSLSTIPEAYRDRSRSGSHDHVYNVMAAMINAGKPEEEIIQTVLKRDAEYNIGYASNYFSCRTCQLKGDTPYERAHTMFLGARGTTERRLAAEGKVLPAEVEVVQSDGTDEIYAINNLLKAHGIKYDFANRKVMDMSTVNLMKEDKDLFQYDGRKWNHCGQAFMDDLRTYFDHAFGWKKKSGTINAALDRFLSFVPCVDSDKQSFFKPNKYLANFKNGTLHVNERSKKLDFLPHNRRDLCTTVIEMEYAENYQPNNEFTQMLDRIFAPDEDRESKIHALEEMFGAALMPIYPRVFFCEGVTGSGKSTIAKILTRLIGNKNICSVDPSSMEGFNMETMVNKLVNMDTDIDSSKPITDGVFKKIEDGDNVRIRRKNIQDINAAIPALHIFMANRLPKNLDGSSRAYGRRTTIITFNRSYTDENPNSFDKNYAMKVFDSHPEGILAFALRGLKRLIENGGHFTTPASGKIKVDEWMKETDLIAHFIDDLKEGEVQGITTNPVIKEDGWALKTELWPIFDKWKREVGKAHVKIGNTAFFAGMNQKGFPNTKMRGKRAIRGIEIPQVELP